MPSDPRKTALLVLNKLEKSQKPLDRIFEDTVDSGDFSVRDRALLQALVYGVLRWQGRLDYTISFFSTTPVNKIDANVLNILRLGLFQIIYMNKIPNSAAVNTAVELAKSTARPWIAGFVNALLRNASENHDKVMFPDQHKDRVYGLTTAKSFPAWLVKRWLNRYGFDPLVRLCDAINTIPPISIRANSLKTSQNKLMLALEGFADNIKPCIHAPYGISFVNPKTRIDKLEAFKNGWFQVQDEAAQLVTLLLDPQPGETILDACAGRGGKTGHIAQQMGNQGEVMALDYDADKLSRLETEMDRLGVSIVSTVHHDLSQGPPDKIFSSYDRILLDAPCSGLGVLRRNPDIKWKTSKKDWKRFSHRQQMLLERLAPLVKVSGVLVYAVCSVEPEENEDVLAAFLSKHTGFVFDTDTGKLPPSIASAIESRGALKTYPLFSEMDGFFMARLKRIK
ncbi:MAG: 16S rRNA (cytosine(967)-C(5))-methyltransferase RsmB [Desulfobacteraceae bacterium]